MITENFKTHEPNLGPNILGTGLVCIDIIKKKDSIRYYNGGSCGNVASALSFLGWNASVITRNYDDAAGAILRKNLANTGVKQIQVGKESINTPRIIEELYGDFDYSRDHRFVFNCPECNRRLPTVKPLTRTNAKFVTAQIDDGFSVFYTDRSSPGVKYLRNVFHGQGKWTIYEPNSARNVERFLENSRNSKIVKFSNERISFNIADRLKDSAQDSVTTLIVFTAGAKGLFYCYRKRNANLSKWHHLNPQPIPRFIDSSGAGDWCTAGIIVGLLGNNQKLRNWLTKTEVISALQFGQALAAISCCFLGGQGLIYADGGEPNEEIFKRMDILNLKRIKPASFPGGKYSNICQTCLLSYG